LREAQEARARKASVTTVVSIARQAAQTAEDARILAVQRKQQEEVAAARDQAARAASLQAQAEAAAQTARTEAEASRALLEQERAARRQAVTTTAAVPAPPPPPQPSIQPPPPAGPPRSELRMRLFGQLNSEMPTRDSPRGLILTIPGSEIRESEVGPAVYQKLARVAAIIESQPGLTVIVEGHGPLSSDWAYAVRNTLIAQGIPSAAISARGLGETRPLVSNATTAGREQNRRVEIIVVGDPIGQMPHWARAYSVMPRR
jgi:flagellar motor protein MotB